MVEPETKTQNDLKQNKIKCKNIQMEKRCLLFEADLTLISLWQFTCMHAFTCRTVAPYAVCYVYIQYIYCD